jgi:hypothetical protein
MNTPAEEPHIQGPHTPEPAQESTEEQASSAPQTETTWTTTTKGSSESHTKDHDLPPADPEAPTEEEVEHAKEIIHQSPVLNPPRNRDYLWMFAIVATLTIVLLTIILFSVQREQIQNSDKVSHDREVEKCMAIFTTRNNDAGAKTRAASAVLDSAIAVALIQNANHQAGLADVIAIETARVNLTNVAKIDVAAAKVFDDWITVGQPIPCPITLQTPIPQPPVIITVPATLAPTPTTTPGQTLPTIGQLPETTIAGDI